MTPHASAVLLAFESGRPVFETRALDSVSLLSTPASLRAEGVPAAMRELEAAGFIRLWMPTADAPEDKPHPQLPLRRYWPEGRIWIRVDNHESGSTVST